MHDEEFLNPKWTEIGTIKPHDWKRYVSHEVRAIWGGFTPEQRILLGRCFEEIANNEEWD
ncbi:recombinase RecA [Klebsiella pneumoniae]|uniref:recombinase RecA n=1 Tax=Klebsiella pneumoniae TaxID=573 RepID=UPI00320C2A14|nr:recombinase RecA [Klebsiella aerogenes]